MRPPTTTQLSRMQAHADESMWDTCEVWEYSGKIDDTYAMPVQKYYLRIPAIICGFDSTSREVMDGTQVAWSDGRVRLPIATTLDNRDRIKIIKRHGVLLTEQPTYELMGDAMRGPSALVLDLKLVTDGSDIDMGG